LERLPKLKRLLVICALGAAGFAHAGFAGTKGDPISSPSGGSSVGFMSMLQMLIALGIVIALLKVVLPKLAGKLNKKLVTSVGSAIRIEESAAFAGGSLYIVHAKNKTLLLSVATTGVSCLADLTNPEPAPELPSFQELVEAEQEGPMQPFAIVNDPQPSPTEEKASAVAALERLKRLSV
jgi:hypothetical protein